MVGVGLSLGLASCGGADESAIDVFAASSLTSAFTEIADDFEASSPGRSVRLSFAGTSTLREQLNDGAEAEVFASANVAIMDDLVASGVITGEVHELATNELVLAVPTGNPAGVAGLGDLADGDLFVGVCAAGVPCGDLAQRLLDDLGIAASVDTFEPNVRSLANRLIDGELDVALIYATDVAAAGDKLQIIDFPPAVAATATYVIAAVDRDDDDARAFVEFVVSSAGRRVLAAWGFEAP